MTPAIKSLFVRAAHQVREIWNETEYAQRRMLEIQTGQRLVSPAGPMIARTIDELESLFAR